MSLRLSAATMAPGLALIATLAAGCGGGKPPGPPEPFPVAGPSEVLDPDDVRRLNALSFFRGPLERYVSGIPPMVAMALPYDAAQTDEQLARHFDRLVPPRSYRSIHSVDTSPSTDATFPIGVRFPPCELARIEPVDSLDVRGVVVSKSDVATYLFGWPDRPIAILVGFDPRVQSPDDAPCGEWRGLNDPPSDHDPKGDSLADGIDFPILAVHSLMLEPFGSTRHGWDGGYWEDRLFFRNRFAGTALAGNGTEIARDEPYKRFEVDRLDAEDAAWAELTIRDFLPEAAFGYMETGVVPEWERGVRIEAATVIDMPLSLPSLVQMERPGLYWIALRYVSMDAEGFANYQRKGTGYFPNNCFLTTARIVRPADQ